jgi:hypothetical protein
MTRLEESLRIRCALSCSRRESFSEIRNFQKKLFGWKHFIVVLVFDCDSQRHNYFQDIQTLFFVVPQRIFSESETIVSTN